MKESYISQWGQRKLNEKSAKYSQTKVVREREGKKKKEKEKEPER